MRLGSAFHCFCFFSICCTFLSGQINDSSLQPFSDGVVSGEKQQVELYLPGSPGKADLYQLGVLDRTIEYNGSLKLELDPFQPLFMELSDVNGLMTTLNFNSL